MSETPTLKTVDLDRLLSDGLKDHEFVVEYVKALQEDAAKQYSRIAELEAALREALENWEECAQYKGDALLAHHGDMDEIARIRALLTKEGVKTDG